MALPNFLIIGAQKSGTTWVGENLGQHPDVHMVMGCYYFDNPANFAKGVAWYENHFRNADGKKIICDKTPSYIWGDKFAGIGDPENVPKRAAELLPRAKIVAILRNPVKRAISSFHHVIRSGKISPFVNIDEALTGDPQGKIKRLGILERGLYYEQLQRWLKHYPREQVHVLIFERDVVQRPKETLTGLAQFLGIDPTFDFRNAHEKVHQKLPRTELILKYYTPWLRKAFRPLMKYLPQSEIAASPATYEYLASYYAGPNAKLAELGLDVSCWSSTAKQAVRTAA